jgi:hypothetical protein
MEQPLACTDRFLSAYESSSYTPTTTQATWQILCDRGALLAYAHWNFGTRFCTRFLREAKPHAGGMYIAPVNFSTIGHYRFTRRRDAERAAQTVRQIAAWTDGRLGREWADWNAAVVVVKR